MIKCKQDLRSEAVQSATRKVGAELEVSVEGVLYLASLLGQ